MTQFPDDRNAELRELFIETALELLQSLNDETLKLEKEPGNLETVRSIRRVVHTLKGEAAAETKLDAIVLPEKSDATAGCGGRIDRASVRLRHQTARV